MDREQEKWAIFWCELLTPVIYGEIEPRLTNQFLKKMAKTITRFPDGRVGKPSLSTLRRKLNRYRAGGFDGLARKGRSDRGKSRSFADEVIEKAIELKKEQPCRSPEKINRFLEEIYGTTIPCSTLYRHLKQANATRVNLPVIGNQWRVRIVTRADKRVFDKWRKSKDKRKWEKAVTILENGNLSPEKIAKKIERPLTVVRKWIRTYNHYGIEGLNRPRKKREEITRRRKIKEKTKRLLEIMHHPPSSFGVNRSNWNLQSIADVYVKEHGESMAKSTAGRLIKKAGYGFRKARKVLTSQDPDYREKVELLLKTLQNLAEDEMFYFIDELGPLQVKKYGGRAYSPKGDSRTFPQNPTTKGSITLSGALSATTNQITWSYGAAKDTQEMIDLIEILFNQQFEKTRLFVTWDAASWHSSNALIAWLDEFNAATRQAGSGPIVELVPLPACSQFLDVIEAVFSGMKRAVIHHSDYQSKDEMKNAISKHFLDRNAYFKENPRRAGKKIWKVDFFSDYENIRSGNYREW